jgi:cytochrome c-type biogenesis protein CcmH
MNRMRILLVLLLLAISGFAHAVKEVELLQTEDEERFHELANELRCMVCQNQTIADSNAELARDFRNQVKEKINAGESNEQIREYMVSRYGDYILYRPPFNMATALLWGGPFLLILVGIVIIARLLKRRPQKDDSAAGVDAQQQARLKKMLEEEGESS